LAAKLSPIITKQKVESVSQLKEGSWRFLALRLDFDGVKQKIATNTRVGEAHKP